MKKIAAYIGAAVLTANGIAGIIAAPANAEPMCGGGDTPWGGGYQCDKDFAADGSHNHCTMVHVLFVTVPQCTWVQGPPQ